MKSIAHFARRQRGFTLVEILVTAVLISVGLLGIAALQLTTLRTNQEAHIRSQASVLASDILDRIRANAGAFRSDEYEVDYNGTGVATTQAGRDLNDWQLTINRTLPGGAQSAAGKIERTEDTQIVTVTIRWVERTRGDGTALTEDLVREFRTRSEI